MRLSDGYLARIPTCQHRINDDLNYASQFTVTFTTTDSTGTSTETTQKIITIPDQIQMIENHRREWNINYLYYIYDISFILKWHSMMNKSSNRHQMKNGMRYLEIIQSGFRNRVWYFFACLSEMEISKTDSRWIDLFQLIQMDRLEKCFWG